MYVLVLKLALSYILVCMYMHLLSEYENVLLHVENVHERLSTVLDAMEERHLSYEVNPETGEETDRDLYEET